MKRIVLVRPSGPRNVGMIVRAAANFGPCELFLVAPERPSLFVHPEFVQMAHGVEQPAARCTIVATLREALSDCTHSYGFSARAREQRRRADWRELRAEAAERANDGSQRVAFVFGNEVTGLSGEEAAQAAELVHIATSSEHTSINLSLAVGIVLADLFLEPPARKRERQPKPLSGADREFLKASLKHVLGAGVARGPYAKRDIEASIERVFSRAALEDRDARAWHLVLRALGNELTPKDLGLPPVERRGRRKAALERRRRAESGDSTAT